MTKAAAYCSKRCSQDSDCPGTDVCRTSTMGNICRKNDGGGGGSDSGAPTPDAGVAPTPDTTPPTVAITSPTAGATVAASIKVVVNANDDRGLASVELKVNGVTAATSNAGPYEFQVALKPGAHTLTAVARDGAGNKSEAAVAITVTGSAGTPDAGAAPDATPGGTPGPGTPDAGAPTPNAPAPKTQGVFGATCGGPTDCKSGLCVADSAHGGSYCTERCNTSNLCPLAGTTCASDANGQRLCVYAPKSGLPQNESQTAGCAAGASAPRGGFVGLALLGLLLLLRRRRLP